MTELLVFMLLRLWPHLSHSSVTLSLSHWLKLYSERFMRNFSGPHLSFTNTTCVLRRPLFTATGSRAHWNQNDDNLCRNGTRSLESIREVRRAKSVEKWHGFGALIISCRKTFFIAPEARLNMFPPLLKRFYSGDGELKRFYYCLFENYCF